MVDSEPVIFKYCTTLVFRSSPHNFGFLEARLSGKSSGFPERCLKNDVGMSLFRGPPESWLSCWFPLKTTNDCGTLKQRHTHAEEQMVAYQGQET